MPTGPSPFLTTVLNFNIPSTSSPRSTSTATQSNPPFTPIQRSLQARGQSFKTTAAYTAGETYEARQKRKHAVEVLDSIELLIWYSAARHESIPATRQHFQNIVYGIEERDEDVAWREEWEVPVEERVGMRDVQMSPRGDKESPKVRKGNKEKGKRRA
ncbi:hypothetical protein CC78DRAFT_534837 [Lojkania enalia]|uniref:Uncharacterized protein n=1 Tax=Lojkania enalia TaxID=147567 RepID=A0A9P4K5S2_9PLEO|nr:hypothetical protein CC78DRAFT_534837 [Didymosphaeria enalia]